MSRHLRRTALVAAAATALSAAAMRGTSDPILPSSFGLFSLPSDAAAAPGHLALARAHPDLRGLCALLTPEAFLLDATHPLAAAALRCQPLSGEMRRLLRREDVATRVAAKVESESGAQMAMGFRVQLAVLATKDGRFDDALDELAHLAAERPSDARPRLCAAGVCYMVGQLEEGNQWLSGIPEDVRHRNQFHLWNAVMAATLGGAPRAVAGFEGLVGFAAFDFIRSVLWAKFLDGDISFVKMKVLCGLLWRGVVAGKYKDYCNGKVSGVRPKDDLHGSILR